MKCPNCKYEIPVVTVQENCSKAGKIKTDKKSKTSAANGSAPCHEGKKRGRPKNKNQ